MALGAWSFIFINMEEMMLEMINKKIIFPIIIFLFLINLALAELNMTPKDKEEAERIAKDFLLDIPLTKGVATELAKNLTGTTGEPEKSDLILYQDVEKGISIPVWNFSFKDKEVLIDATNGKLINVKIKENLTPLKIFGNPTFIIVNVLIFSFIIIYLFKFLMDKYFKKEKIPTFYEEEKV